MPLYDDRFHKLIATNIVCSVSICEIVDALKVSKGIVNNYHYNIDTFGMPIPPPFYSALLPSKDPCYY